MIPSKASVWWRRASIASIYPLGGPRFRDGPRKVQAVAFNEHFVLILRGYKNKNEKSAPSIAIAKYWRDHNAQTTPIGLSDSRVPSIAQLLHSSSDPERSHLHLDLRH